MARETMHVFLSYDARDRDYAAKLAESLSREGFDVWYAHAQLYPGDNWPLKTGKALEESDALVVLLSPEAMKSASVQAEIDYALVNESFKWRLVPVLLRPTRGIPWILEKLGVIRAGKSISETAKQVAQTLRQAEVKAL